MSTNIYFRKILDYDPTLGGIYTKYEGYYRCALQLENPHIKKANLFKLNLPAENFLEVFSSTLLRAQETAQTYPKANKITVVDELIEVKFDLKTLLTEEEYSSFGSNLVRTRFVEHFIHNMLDEKHIDIKKRIDKVFELFLKKPSGNYLVISHSFFMKIFQAYFENNNLFETPDLIRKYIHAEQKTFEFGAGFQIKI